MMMILLCDRDPVFVDTITHLLAEEGYTVEAVNCPGEAIRRLLPGRFGVMVLGVHSGEAEDVGLIPMVNRIDRQLPIVVIAADESLELERRARTGKLFYYAVRPVDSGEFKEVVKEACMKRVNGKY
jgi:DNA-binding NtrC family response regulator